MSNWMVVLLALVSVLAQASESAGGPEALLQAFPPQVLRYEVVEFKPAKGHHFSLEAPQKCGDGGVLVERFPRVLKCQLTAEGETQVALNVCDDAKTFCKPVAARVRVKASSGAAGRILRKNQDLNQKVKHALAPGFQIGELSALRSVITQKKSGVLVMVSTDWCPPCNEAKEFLLPTEAFKKATANWTKIYVDGDSLSASEWQKVVPYRYYPTFVFLNHRLEEIGRFGGALRQKDFSDWAEEVEQNLNDPIFQLKDRVLARAQGAWLQRWRDRLQGLGADRLHADEVRLLKWALRRGDGELVDQLVKGHPPQELQVDWDRYELDRLQRQAERGQGDDKGRRVELYRQWLGRLFEEDGWAQGWSEFCSLDVAACADQKSRVEARLKFLNERGGVTPEERASSLGDEYYYLSEVFQLLGDKAAEKKWAAQCVSEFEKMSLGGTRKLSRAARQGMLVCLEVVGDLRRAVKELGPLIEAYPSEPTFPIRMARILLKAQRPREALPWVERAEKVAYGYNWINVEMLKADVLLALKRGDEALVVIQTALDQVQLDASPDSRSQISVSRLRAAQAKISAAGAKL